MARDPQFEPVYQAFNNFKQKCLVEDRSILWPDRNIWSLSNTQEFVRLFIESGIFGTDLSFENKLEIQLKDAEPYLWGMVAELLYVYYLPSNYIKPDTKYAAILWASRKGNLVPPPQSDAIFKAQFHGFTRTAIKYHSKFGQFRLLIELAVHIKDKPNRQEFLDNPIQLQNQLDEILDSIPDKRDRAYDMRHAILYMSFPERYERIISTRDKERIIDTYKDLLSGPVPADNDEALLSIRNLIAPRYSNSEHPFDFYTHVKSEWRPPDGRAIKDSPETSEISEPPEVMDPDIEQVMKTLEHSKSVILYGPPGTGKTYIAKNVAEALTEPQYVRWVTFHQSYSYEDFVEGLRPVISEDNTEGIAYQIVPGAFRQLCTRAAADPNNQYVLIIDEINRGNIAKVMGELITLLEEDKRTAQPNEISVQLPYSQELFTVPVNLYIIGTMNTADRSIALLDVALRRRFAFVKIMPRAELLNGDVIETEDAMIKLDALLINLNEFIKKHIDSDHQIGHSYFMGVDSEDESESLEKLIYVWKNQISPLLEEYFYRQREKLDLLFAPAASQEDQAEYTSNIESDDDLIYALMDLSKR